MYAATAWHWVDPALRYAKAHRLLRPAGHLAFWSALHAFPEGFDPFFTEIQGVYDAIGESFDGEWPPTPPDQAPDSSEEIQASGLFEDIRVRRYVWEREYTADEYVALLDTFSGHISMEAPRRERLYREIRVRLGGRRVRRHWYAILHVARRSSRRTRKVQCVRPRNGVHGERGGLVCGLSHDGAHTSRAAIALPVV